MDVIFDIDLCSIYNIDLAHEATFDRCTFSVETYIVEMRKNIDYRRFCY